MPQDINSYDDLAAFYHLQFEDWDAGVRWQGAVLSGVIEGLAGPGPKTVLDAACGIGTQAIGLALQGHSVTGSDLSTAAVARAQREAKRFAVGIAFQVADMRSLSRIHGGPYDVVCAFDNAVAHFMDDAELTGALREMTALAAPGGLVVLSIRDYDAILEARPTGTPERVFGGEGGRRRVYQEWDWLDETVYDFRIVIEEAGATHAFSGRYRAVTRGQINAALAAAGFGDVRWLMPEESGYYQPIVAAGRSG